MASIKRLVIFLMVIIAITMSVAAEDNTIATLKTKPIYLGKGLQSESVKIEKGLQSESVKIGKGVLNDPVNLDHSTSNRYTDPHPARAQESVVNTTKTSVNATKPDINTTKINTTKINTTKTSVNATKPDINTTKINTTKTSVNATELNASATKVKSLPIYEVASLDEIFGLNHHNYYKKSEFFIKTPAYGDISDFVGVGFIANTNGSDCGQRASYLDWLLKRHGFNTSIIVDDNFPGINCPHAWVKVTTAKKEQVYIDACGYPDLTKNERYIKRDSIYKVNYSDKNIHEFGNIEEVLKYYGDITGERNLDFAWWNTAWGRSILKREGLQVGTA